MATATCAWPHRSTVSGAFCRATGYRAAGLMHAYCPWHIGEARRWGEPYPVALRSAS